MPKYRIEYQDIYDEDYTSSNWELDVAIIFNSGSRYVVSFYTIDKLKELVSIESDRPINFIIGSNDMILLNELTKGNAKIVIDEIVKNEHYWDIFTPINELAIEERIRMTKPKTAQEVDHWMSELDKKTKPK